MQNCIIICINKGFLSHNILLHTSKTESIIRCNSYYTPVMELLSKDSLSENNNVSVDVFASLWLIFFCYCIQG